MSLQTDTPTNPLINPEVEYEAPENGANQTRDIPDPPKPQEAPKDDVLDTLVPKAKSVQWVIGPEGARKTYVQRPLSFLAKMQWFALVGEVLDKALAGENGLRLNNLLETPGRRGQLSMSDFRDADTFVQAIGKLLTVAPDFLVKSYCIWLGVPDYERDLAAAIMALSPEDGGLSDQQGIEIIETFIDQNYEALDSFFREQIGNLSARIQKRAEEVAASRR